MHFPHSILILFEFNGCGHLGKASPILTAIGRGNFVEPLRILFICPYLPSLIRVRPYNLIQALARRGHLITLLALEPPAEDAGGLDALRQWCQRVEVVPLPGWRTLWNGVQALPTRTPLQAAYSRSPQMARLIRQVQSEAAFDVAHVEHLRGAELSRAVEGVPVVFDSVDSITLLFEHVRHSGPTWRSRLKAGLDLARTRHYEGQLLERYQRVLVTSPCDRDALVRISATPDGDGRLVVLPNGVDLDYFAPRPRATPRDPATIIFTGKMSYHANTAAALDLATQVMPHVWQQRPNARLAIVGKDPPAKLLALTGDPRVTVTGFVPDLRPYLAQATVAVSPIRYGVGIQNKVLEAMAMAAPVVSTPQATTALQAQAGRDLLVASAPQSIAEAILSLLASEALSRQVGHAGRCYVETHHNWGLIAEKLETVYHQAIAEAGGQSRRPAAISH
jgi:sugar transferase (PEP-CTERM/EpsH1 system associated)